MAQEMKVATYDVKKGDFVTAGEASAAIKGILKKLGVESKTLRRVAVATYEVELNLVIHSLGGTLSLLVAPDCVTVISEDVGPGIADIEKAMTEGYSTAPASVRDLGFGAGMGLPNMKRNADTFAIESTPDVGTKITMGFHLEAST